MEEIKEFIKLFIENFHDSEETYKIFNHGSGKDEVHKKLVLYLATKQIKLLEKFLKEN